MHRRVSVELIAGVLLLAAVSCGSESPASVPESEAVPEGPVVARPDDTFTLDSIISAGWKKSKQLSADTLPGADEVWYGFYEQKDIEIRIYASHEEALALGLNPAEEAIGRTGTSAEAGGKLDQSRSRTGYDAVVIAGNVIMLCELDVSTCEALISNLD